MPCHSTPRDSTELIFVMPALWLLTVRLRSKSLFPSRCLSSFCSVDRSVDLRDTCRLTLSRWAGVLYPHLPLDAVSHACVPSFVLFLCSVPLAPSLFRPPLSSSVFLSLLSVVFLSSRYFSLLRSFPCFLGPVVLLSGRRACKDVQNGAVRRTHLHDASVVARVLAGSRTLSFFRRCLCFLLSACRATKDVPNERPR